MVELAGPLLLSVLMGSQYTMMALGLTMTYAITRVPNFAHAEFVTVGGYAAVAFVNVLGGGLIESLLGGFLAGAIVAMLSDELVFKPLFRRGATPLHLLVASIGVGLVIRYVLSIVVASYDFLVVKSRINKEILFSIGTAPFTNLHAWVLPTTFAVVIALHALFTQTRMGKAMRAMASNFDLARVAGIRTAQVRRWTWFLAGGLAGVGGAFWVVNVPCSRRRAGVSCCGYSPHRFSEGSSRSGARLWAASSSGSRRTWGSAPSTTRSASPSRTAR